MQRSTRDALSVATCLWCSVAAVAEVTIDSDDGVLLDSLLVCWEVCRAVWQRFWANNKNNIEIVKAIL